MSSAPSLTGMLFSVHAGAIWTVASSLVFDIRHLRCCDGFHIFPLQSCSCWQKEKSYLPTSAYRGAEARAQAPKKASLIRLMNKTICLESLHHENAAKTVSVSFVKAESECLACVWVHYWSVRVVTRAGVRACTLTHTHTHTFSSSGQN